MKVQHLLTAIDEAERFLTKAKRLRAAQKAAEKDSKWEPSPWVSASPSGCAEVKRASMDLTRALADVRRPS